MVKYMLSKEYAYKMLKMRLIMWMISYATNYKKSNLIEKISAGKIITPVVLTGSNYNSTELQNYPLFFVMKVK